MSEATNGQAREALLDQFLQQYEQAEDPALVLSRCCASHPQLAEEFTALAESHRILARVQPDPEPAFPARLGDFRIVRKIGWGGMGDVYEAVQEPFERRVAVKTIRPGQVSPSVRVRFLREQQVLAGLHQTHIVPIFAAGCVGETHYFAMPYLHGVSLRDVLYDLRAECTSPQPAGVPTAAPALGGPHRSTAYFQAVAALMADAAEALAHAHERGIVHRDLKPANLMIDAEGHLWILDFGLAGYLGGEPAQLDPGEPATAPGDLTNHSGTPGTLDYMAPEQLDGRADNRTDVWGLGTVLYELLTLHRADEGVPPIPGPVLLPGGVRKCGNR